MKNVLLVDDDDICNFINRKTFQGTGRVRHIDTALNGQQALERLNNHEPLSDHPGVFPDLIVLDLNMPVMDGFAFLKAYKEISFPNKSEVKIIVVSSSQNEDDIERAKALGAHLYLSKPLNAFAAMDMLTEEEGAEY